MIVAVFYDFKITQAFINTKKLGISFSTQLLLTASEFGEVQVTTNFWDLSEQGKGRNILKDGVTVADFQNVNLSETILALAIQRRRNQTLGK